MKLQSSTLFIFYAKQIFQEISGNFIHGKFSVNRESKFSEVSSLVIQHAGPSVEGTYTCTPVVGTVASAYVHIQKGKKVEALYF